MFTGDVPALQQRIQELEAELAKKRVLSFIENARLEMFKPMEAFIDATLITAHNMVDAPWWQFAVRSWGRELLQLHQRFMNPPETP